MSQPDVEIRHLKVARFCTWMGLGYVLLWLIGFYLAGMLPPISAADSAQATTQYYVDHLGAVRIGSFLMIVFGTLITPWGIVIAALTRRGEKGVPILFYIQIASVAISAADIMFIGDFYAVAAYRPGETTAEITQTWNDIAWFGVLFTWPPFSVWCAAIAFAILGDRSEHPAFPRWVAYLNLWAALLFVPAGGMLFFKVGPFSQSGIITFWVPMCTYFAWLVTMSVQMLKALSEREGEKRLAYAAIAGA